MTNIRDDLRLGVNSTEIFITKNNAPTFADYSIILAGITHINDDYYFARQGAQFHVVLYCVSGEGVLHSQNNDQSFLHQIKAGELISLPCNQTYSYELAHDKWHFLWFILDPTMHWDFLKTTTVKNIENGHRIKPMLRLLNDETNNELKPILVKEIYKILSGNLKPTNVNNPFNDLQNFKLRQLFEEVCEQLHYPWTAEILAERMHCAVPTLHRYCQKEFNTSPMQYVITLRINRAKILLKDTSWTLDVIAAQLGYANGLSFSKAFKQKEGISPKHFKHQ